MVTVASSLGSSVLVLNRLYMAVHVIGARRAFALIYRNLAEVIHFEEGQFGNYDFETWRVLSELKVGSKRLDEDWVTAVNFEILVPRVIRLMTYDRLPRSTVAFSRRSVLARDANRCQYCARRFPTRELSLDHVVPRSRGGEMTWENVVCSCVRCNVKKGGRTPREANMKLLRRPTKPTRCPILSMKLSNPKYASWKTFLELAT